MAEDTFEIPRGAVFDLTDEGIVLGNRSNVVIHGTMGGRIAKIYSEEGSVTVDLPPHETCDVKGIEAAKGTVTLSGNIRTNSIKAQALQFKSGKLQAKSVISQQRIQFDGEEIQSTFLMAPEVRFNPNTKGRAMIVECQNDLGPSRVKGCFGLDEYMELAPGVQQVLQQELSALRGRLVIPAPPPIPPVRTAPMAPPFPTATAAWIEPPAPEPWPEPDRGGVEPPAAYSSPPSAAPAPPELPAAAAAAQPAPPSPDAFESDNVRVVGTTEDIERLGESFGFGGAPEPAPTPVAPPVEEPLSEEEAFRAQALEVMTEIEAVYTGDRPSALVEMRQWISDRQYRTLYNQISSLFAQIRMFHADRNTTVPDPVVRNFQRLSELLALQTLS